MLLKIWMSKKKKIWMSEPHHRPIQLGFLRLEVELFKIFTVTQD